MDLGSCLTLAQQFENLPALTVTETKTDRVSNSLTEKRKHPKMSERKLRGATEKTV